MDTQRNDNMTVRKATQLCKAIKHHFHADDKAKQEMMDIIKGYYFKDNAM